LSSTAVSDRRKAAFHVAVCRRQWGHRVSRHWTVARPKRVTIFPARRCDALPACSEAWWQQPLNGAALPLLRAIGIGCCSMQSVEYPRQTRSGSSFIDCDEWLAQRLHSVRLTNLLHRDRSRDTASARRESCGTMKRQSSCRIYSRLSRAASASFAAQPQRSLVCGGTGRPMLTCRPQCRGFGLRLPRQGESFGVADRRCFSVGPAPSLVQKPDRPSRWRI
jgi:hypothetical protein